MSVLVVGLGSMGRRRIRLMKNHYSIDRIVGVDTNEERRIACENEFAIETANSISEAFDMSDFEYAFICSSPLSHAGIITECLQHSVNVFTEINLVKDGYESNVELARNKGVNLFISSTPIYREEMKFVTKQVDECGENVFYTYHVGQYLPDWHPWEDCRNFFVGDKRTNGCREIFAIELPWLIKAFGEIEKCHVIRKSLLDIGLEFCDCYTVQVCHKNGNCGTLIFDVVARNPIRELRVIGANTFVSWNGTPDSLFVRNKENGELNSINLYNDVEHNDMYNSTIVENGYINEIGHFFDECNGKTPSMYTFEEDKHVIEIIDDIEEGIYD